MVYFVQYLDWFDVVVVSNFFGDILFDLGLVVVGGMGIVFGVNINLEKEFLSMFELVYGSVLDIVGKGIVNFIVCIWIGVMMLDYLGKEEVV